MNISINQSSQFAKDLQDGTSSINRGRYNLIVTIRDLKLYTKIGMKPHRNWKVSDVKNYFGVKGKPEQILQILEEIHLQIKTEKEV